MSKEIFKPYRPRYINNPWERKKLTFDEWKIYVGKVLLRHKMFDYLTYGELKKLGLVDMISNAKK